MATREKGRERERERESRAKVDERSEYARELEWRPSESEFQKDRV